MVEGSENSVISYSHVQSETFGIFQRRERNKIVLAFYVPINIILVLSPCMLLA